MKRFEFTDDLMTGIPEIDNQHRELFACINALLFPEGGRPTVKGVADALLFLRNYANIHFSIEERLMKYYSYDRLKGHQRQHQILQCHVNVLYERAVKYLRIVKYKRAVKYDTFNGLLTELFYLFDDWHAYHIKEWDKAYAAYLQDRANYDFIIFDGLDDVDDSVVGFL